MRVLHFLRYRCIVLSEGITSSSVTVGDVAKVDAVYRVMRKWTFETILSSTKKDKSRLSILYFK
jgi:hypothetical protein